MAAEVGAVADEATGGPQLAIVYQRVDQLKPHPGNARAHSKRQIKKIAESMRAFGFNCPILVDADGYVISGHGRLLACRELGRDEVPTISLEHLTPAQARAFAIADNRIAELATWDDQRLGEQFRLLSEMRLDFNLDLTGFEVAQIDTLIEGPTTDVVDRADTKEVCLEGPAVSCPGDLWLLDRHRIYCGSALDEAAYQDYEIGYGRPPKATRFPKGVSGQLERPPEKAGQHGKR